MFCLIFIVFRLDSRLSLWQRKATQVLIAALTHSSVFEPVASLSQFFLTAIQ